MTSQPKKAKPTNRQDLARYYGISPKQLSVWLQNHHPDIFSEVKGKQLFTPAQVDRILDLFGEP